MRLFFILFPLRNRLFSTKFISSFYHKNITFKDAIVNVFINNLLRNGTLKTSVYLKQYLKLIYTEFCSYDEYLHILL